MSTTTDARNGLKAQLRLAQGIALGHLDDTYPAPCKGNCITTR